jgi:hypothetical protein
MEHLQTMDLSGNDSGMVQLKPPSGNTELKPPEKNISINSKDDSMDATPIDEVMGLNDLSSAQIPQDPRMVPQYPQPVAQQQVVAQPHANTLQQPQMAKNPMNLTDDQMEALFVGVVASIAFSKPVQEKLAGMIPQFTAENGHRSNVGMVLSAIVAAILYFFGRRFVMKN